MTFHVPEKFRLKHGPLPSETSDGNNGAFQIPVLASGSMLIIASDGAGWEHVSVSFPHRVPSWREMCTVKDMFWDDDDCVIQFHPAKSEYVNFAKNCLHLWRPTQVKFPTPPTWMVGPKGEAD